MSQKLSIGFIVLLALSLVLALVFKSEVATNWLAWIAAVIVVAAWLLKRGAVKASQDGKAFTWASIMFLGLWGIVGAIHFPNLVAASNNTANSLTILNASSTELTRKVMFIIALVGMPIVIGYTIYAYRVFKGKGGMSVRSIWRASWGMTP